MMVLLLVLLSLPLEALLRLVGLLLLGGDGAHYPVVRGREGGGNVRRVGRVDTRGAGRCRSGGYGGLILNLGLGMMLGVHVVGVLHLDLLQVLVVLNLVRLLVVRIIVVLHLSLRLRMSLMSLPVRVEHLLGDVLLLNLLLRCHLMLMLLSMRLSLSLSRMICGHHRHRGGGYVVLLRVELVRGLSWSSGGVGILVMRGNLVFLVLLRGLVLVLVLLVMGVLNRGVVLQVLDGLGVLLVSDFVLRLSCICIDLVVLDLMVLLDGRGRQGGLLLLLRRRGLSLG